MLEGPGSSGEAYITTTQYDDQAHVRLVTDPRGTRTRSALDGLDRVIGTTVDVGGLELTTRTTYDGLGSITSVTDPNGNDTAQAYDGLGRLVRRTDALGNQTTFEYDGEGLKTSERDRRGVVTTLSYDNLRRPRKTTVVPSISNVSWSGEVQYDDAGRRRTHIDAAGRATISALDGLDRVVRTIDPLGQTIVAEYDGVNKIAETDKRGNRTAFAYDALNRLTTTTDPAPFANQTIETTYQDAQNRRVERDRRGTVAATQLDPLGRTRSVSRNGIQLETSAYDDNGNRTSTTDAEGKQTLFGYDAANRLISETPGFGTPAAATTRYDYDRNGNRTSELDARAAELGELFSVRSTYDALNRLATATDGEGGTTSYEYDHEGNKTAATDPLGHRTAYEYDELDKLVAVIQPGSVTTRYEYDRNRNLITQTDANGHAVRMEYDRLNRLQRRIQPGGIVTSYSYDANGNEAEVTDPKGQRTASTYDALNRIVTKAFGTLPAEIPTLWRHPVRYEYSHDPNGNLTQVDEYVASGTDPPNILRTTRAYDPLDRLIADTTPLPDGGFRTLSYTYFRNGTRQALTDPAGRITTYSYDGQDRLATVTTDAGVTQYSYFPDDLLRLTTLPNGVTATHHYDRADRVTSIANEHGEEVLSSYDYVYDADGNRSSQVEVNGGLNETTTYTYDVLDRLASVAYPVDTRFPNGRVVTYEYDNVGNRLRETERTNAGALLADKQGAFDPLNRLTQLEDHVAPLQSTAFTYDANGNQTAKAVAGVTTIYLYDSRDKMAEAQQGASILARFQYDFEGRRNKKVGEEGVRAYLYDGGFIWLEYDVTGVQVAKYTYGASRIISVDRRDEPQKFYNLDVLGSVVGLSDTGGVLSSYYHLDAWGNYRNSNELLASRNRVGFSGHLWDSETSLFNARARLYDPGIGRFTTQDTVTGQSQSPASLHRYGYAVNNPTGFVDPTGNVAESVWDAFSLGLGAGSLYHNIKQKNLKMAGIDAIGVLADTAALAVPFVPGGAGAAIRASRVTKLSIDALQTARRAW